MSTSPAQATRVRLTVDLSPAEHVELRQRCLDYSAALGIARVTHGDVVRALLVQLRADPDLADLVRGRLAEAAGGRRHVA